MYKWYLNRGQGWYHFSLNSARFLILCYQQYNIIAVSNLCSSTSALFFVCVPIDLFFRLLNCLPQNKFSYVATPIFYKDICPLVVYLQSVSTSKYRSVLVTGKKILGVRKSYVGVSSSLIGLIISYVGVSKSYLGVNKS